MGATISIPSPADAGRGHGGTRFGFVLGQQRAPFGAYLDEWLRAEASGLEVGYVFDHFAHERGAGRSAWFDAYATLAALSPRTQRVRLGVLVTGASLRHPAQIAKTAATIDHASGGRFELGLGAGGAAVDHAFFGMPMPSFATRVSALEESLMLVRMLFDGELVTFEGRHFTAKNVTLEPKPVQRHLPIWVGGDHPAIVRLAGALADGWNCYRMPAAAYRTRVKVLEDAVDRAGRAPEDVRQSMVVKLVLAECQTALDRRVAELASRSGLATEDVASAVIGGRPSDWVDELGALHELGVREFAIDLEADEPDVNRDLLARVASDVVPVFASR